MIPDREPFTSGVIRLLEHGTGKRIGDHVAPFKPDEVPDDDYFPYAIVYSLNAGHSTGSLANQHEDADFIYQVTSVGMTRVQAEWMADRVRHVWCARTTGGAFQVPFEEPTGWAVAGRIQADEGFGGVDRESDPPFEVWSVPDRYYLQVTPVFQGV